jgi:hypothetical protein
MKEADVETKMLNEESFYPQTTQITQITQILLRLKNVLAEAQSSQWNQRWFEPFAPWRLCERFNIHSMNF